MRISVLLENRKAALLMVPGDEIVLSNGDRIVYLTGKEAEAHRLLVESRREAVQQTIDFWRRKIADAN